MPTSAQAALTDPYFGFFLLDMSGGPEPLPLHVYRVIHNNQTHPERVPGTSSLNQATSLRESGQPRIL